MRRGGGKDFLFSCRFSTIFVSVIVRKQVSKLSVNFIPKYNTLGALAKIAKKKKKKKKKKGKNGGRDDTTGRIDLRVNFIVYDETFTRANNFLLLVGEAL